MNSIMEKTEIREDTEWIDFRWHNAPDQTQRRILLIGDSIVVGHGGYVHGLMKKRRQLRLSSLCR